MNGPLDLGWPSEYAIPELPESIYGSETGYAGTNNLHRRPYNKVEKAQRSLFLVRGKHPYTIICDDVKKDSEPHLYEWYMQLPMDLEVKANKGNEVILAEAEGDREMLVRFLQEEVCSSKVEKYQVSRDRQGKITNGKRMIASVTCVEPKLRTLLFPYKAGQSLPALKWNRGRTVLTVTFDDQVDVLTFAMTDEEGTKITLLR